MNNKKEVVVLTVYKDYYQKHIDIFKHPNTTVKSVYVEGEDNTNDAKHKTLLKKYMEVKKELRDYEFNKRHNK